MWSSNIAGNVSGLGEGGEYEAQNCLPALHLIRSTNVQLTTEPPLSLSPCYALPYSSHEAVSGRLCGGFVRWPALSFC
ncbi:MAG: hypothetical protein ACK5JQ_04705, partial [Bacteroidota bacterium]